MHPGGKTHLSPGPTIFQAEVRFNVIELIRPLGQSLMFVGVKKLYNFHLSCFALTPTFHLKAQDELYSSEVKHIRVFI